MSGYCRPKKEIHTEIRTGALHPYAILRLQTYFRLSLDCLMGDDWLMRSLKFDYLFGLKNVYGGDKRRREIRLHWLPTCQRSPWINEIVLSYIIRILPTSLPSFSSVTLLGSEEIACKVNVFFSPPSATTSAKHDS